MYIKSNAMLKPGKIIPTIGTSMDGKYDAVMPLLSYCLYLFVPTILTVAN